MYDLEMDNEVSRNKLLGMLQMMVGANGTDALHYCAISLCALVSLLSNVNSLADATVTAVGCPGSSSGRQQVEMSSVPMSQSSCEMILRMASVRSYVESRIEHD
ncbi:hypothetical protein AHF37_06606 [Paragonimus kellicotti]|nr:hypothetical protein AHF37_06606 [Paragonimus kellicotti]